MFTIEQVRKAFTDWAPRYNATHAWGLLKRREARLALDVQPGDRLLEIACGTGLNFPHLRRLTGDRGSIVGVDLTPAMLDIARQQIARKGWTNVEVREADAARLPFPDASFDKAFCAFALNIIPDYERAIAEVWRVLVPGGRFAALEMRSMDVSSLSGWLGNLAHRLMGVCAVDSSHRTLEAIQEAFGEVQLRRYLAGMVFTAVARKRPPGTVENRDPYPESGQRRIGSESPGPGPAKPSCAGSSPAVASNQREATPGNSHPAAPQPPI